MSHLLGSTAFAVSPPTDAAATIVQPMATLAARGETGMATAEYAVGTVSACGFAGLLFKLLTSDLGQSMLESILSKVTGLLPF